MRAAELMQLIRRRPFEPLRIPMTDGTTYDIQHPDQIIVAKQRIDIGIEPDPKTGVVDRTECCSLLQVVRVEDLASASSSDGTGH